VENTVLFKTECLRTPSFVHSSSHNGFLLEFDLTNLLAGGHHVLVLDAHNATSPGASKLIVLVVLLAECLFEGLKVFVVLLSYLSKGDARGGLHVHNFAEVGLAANKAVWHVAFTAESGEENNHLDWVNIMSDHDQLGTLLFNELSDVVETELDVHGLRSFLGVLVSGS